MTNKQKGLHGRGYEKLDAREKFESAQRGLKVVERRLADSRRKEKADRKDLEELEAKRKSLMARDYLERTKKHAEERGKVEKALERAKKKFEDSAAISTELSELLIKKKEELKVLELEYLREGQEVFQEKLSDLNNQYLEKKEEMQKLRKEATAVKEQIEQLRRQQQALEREERSQRRLSEGAEASVPGEKGQ